MQLFKFCNQEHNIHRGAKLQVGTLFGYRTIEDPELKDEAEGKYKFQIDFPEPIELDRRWANLLLQGTIAFGETADVPRFPGSYRAHAERLHMVTQTKDGVVVTDTRIQIEREVPNCLIFCMSLLDSAEKKPFGTYSDHWSIPEHRADEFGRRLGSLIFQQAKLSAFDEAILNRHSAATVQGLSLNVRHQRVTYRDRQLVITPKSRPSFEELVGVLSDIAFVKPERFSSEQEYRFVFSLVDGQAIFPPRVERLLLNPNVLTDLSP